jgi:putative ABC transport system substrate-binding protein
VWGRPLFSIAQAKLVVERAAAHWLPVIFVEFGGLMAFGVDVPQHYRRVAWYVDQILRGAKPADSRSSSRQSSSWLSI